MYFDWKFSHQYKTKRGFANIEYSSEDLCVNNQKEIWKVSHYFERILKRVASPCSERHKIRLYIILIQKILPSWS